MNPEPDRICPFCAETIHAEAKVCPRCRQWLSLRSLRHPITALLVTGVPGLAVCAAFAWIAISGFGRLLDPRPRYSEVPGALEILESRMNWLEATNGPTIYVTGILTNQSAVAWKDLEFECRFFDTNGVMVDVGNAPFLWTIQAQDDLAFRVRVTPVRPATDYDSVRLLVSAARNARSRF